MCLKALAVRKVISLVTGHSTLRNSELAGPRSDSRANLLNPDFAFRWNEKNKTTCDSVSLTGLQTLALQDHLERAQGNLLGDACREHSIELPRFPSRFFRTTY